MQLNDWNIEHLYQLPCHVYWKDLTGVYRGSNDYPAMLLGVPKSEEILGLTDFDLCYSENARNFRCNDRTVIAQAKPLFLAEEVKWLKQDIYYAVYSHKQPLHNDKGDIIGVLGMSFILSPKNKLQLFDNNL